MVVFCPGKQAHAADRPGFEQAPDSLSLRHAAPPSVARGGLAGVCHWVRTGWRGVFEAVGDVKAGGGMPCGVPYLAGACTSRDLERR